MHELVVAETGARRRVLGSFIELCKVVAGIRCADDGGKGTTMDGLSQRMRGQQLGRRDRTGGIGGPQTGFGQPGGKGCRIWQSLPSGPGARSSEIGTERLASRKSMIGDVIYSNLC